MRVPLYGCAPIPSSANNPGTTSHLTIFYAAFSVSATLSRSSCLTHVEAALSAICPYDWHTFFETRIYQVNSKPLTDGLEAGGWRLVYNATPNEEPFYSELLPFSYNGTYSIGLSVKKDGTIFDVLPGMPAYAAGLGPDMIILGVDGRVYSSDVLNESVAHPRKGEIFLVVRNFDSVETREIQYAGGVRYPHLERIPGTHDYLSEILQPRK
jgi:predicted metalloprotease with PDZ domain